jgi:hypothetical protein
MFSSQSKARIMQTRYQLATLKKGAFFIPQTLAHTLAVMHRWASQGVWIEVVSYFLAGLSSDYDPLITSITTSTDPISLDDLYGNLLTHEQWIELHNIALDLSSSSVHVA